MNGAKATEGERIIINKYDVTTWIEDFWLSPEDAVDDKEALLNMVVALLKESKAITEGFESSRIVIKSLTKRVRILEEIAYSACDLIDNHDEIVGESCKSCGMGGGDATHGEVLAKLLDEFTHR